MVIKPGLIRFLGLPALSSQTLAALYDGSLPAGQSYARLSNAWNSETGLIAPANMFLNSAVGVTQNITASATPTTGQLSLLPTHLSFKGTGSITISGTGSGTLAGTGANDRVELSFTPTAGTVTFTVTGTVTEVNVHRGTFQIWVPTVASAVYAPRYLQGKQGQGILVESASTNKCTAWSIPKDTDTAGVKLTGSGSFNNMTLSGDAASTLSVVLDQAAIDSAIALNPTDGSMVALMAARANGYKVYKLDNSAGSTTGIVTVGGVSSTTPHTISSVVRRGSAGLTRFGDNGAEKIITFTNAEYLLLNNSPWTPTGFRSVYYLASAGQTIFFLAPQLEESPYATSPILCNGVATTRAAGTPSSPTAGVVAVPATIQCWWKPEGVAAGKVQTLWSTGSVADYTRIVYSGTQLIFTKAKTAQTTETITYTVAITANTWNWFALDFNADGTCVMWHNGAIVGTNGTTTAFAPIIAATFQPGAFNGTLQADSVLDNYRYFSRVTTAAEKAVYYTRGK